MTYDTVMERVRTIPAGRLPDVLKAIDAFAVHKNADVQQEASGMARFRKMRGKIQFLDGYDYKAMRTGCDIS